MERIKIILPFNLPFTAQIPVRVTDLNYAGHVGNDSFLSLIHEIRLQLLAHFDYTELSVENTGTIMADVAMQYRGEVFYPDTLICHAGFGSYGRTGFDVYYQILSHKSGKEVLKAKTSHVFYDYQLRKMLPTPDAFKRWFPNQTSQSE